MEIAMASVEGPLGRKTRIFTALVILTNVLGNFLLSRGMRQVGETDSFSVPAYLAVFANPWVDTGVVLLALWLLAQLSLLSWADLSYVLPVTAIAYVLTALLGRMGGESVDAVRWIGILLITAGAILVGRTTAVSSKLGLSGEAG
jgi:uncharacterized membrane protein